MKRIAVKYAVSLMIGLLLFGFTGCRSGNGKPDEPVIKVGGRSITLKQYQDALNRLIPPGNTNTKEEAAELKKDLLNQLVEEELILNEADKAGIKVDQDELASEVDGLKKEYGDESFKDAVIERYGSLENWKSEIKKKLLIRKTIEKLIASKPPADADVKKYFEEHREEFNIPEQAHARMIVVTTEEEAKKIRSGLTPENFAETAKKYSLSPEKESGGDLGFFSPGEMPKEFEDAVSRLKPGQISPVLKTEYGYHIFLLESRRKGGKAKLKEVKSKIIERLRNENDDAELVKWISSLKGNTRIEVREDLL